MRLFIYEDVGAECGVALEVWIEGSKLGAMLREGRTTPEKIEKLIRKAVEYTAQTIRDNPRNEDATDATR